MALKDIWKDLQNATEGIAGSGDDVSAEPINMIAHAVIDNEINLAGKVDKVDGKGLSTEDYTTAEKEKLSGLANYDDTELVNLINDKIDKSAITTVVNAESKDNEIPTAQAAFEHAEGVYYRLNPRVTETENSIVTLTNRISSVEVSIGDIDTALDSIIAIQNELIGGGTV